MLTHSSAPSDPPLRAKRPHKGSRAKGKRSKRGKKSRKANVSSRRSTYDSESESGLGNELTAAKDEAMRYHLEAAGGDASLAWRSLMIAINVIISIGVVIASFQLEWDHQSGVTKDTPVADGLRWVVFGSTIILLLQITELYHAQDKLASAPGVFIYESSFYVELFLSSLHAMPRFLYDADSELNLLVLIRVYHIARLLYYNSAYFTQRREVQLYLSRQAQRDPESGEVDGAMPSFTPANACRLYLLHYPTRVISFTTTLLAVILAFVLNIRARRLTSAALDGDFSFVGSLRMVLLTMASVNVRSLEVSEDWVLKLVTFVSSLYGLLAMCALACVFFMTLRPTYADKQAFDVLTELYRVDDIRLSLSSVEQSTDDPEEDLGLLPSPRRSKNKSQQQQQRSSLASLSERDYGRSPKAHDDDDDASHVTGSELASSRHQLMPSHSHSHSRSRSRRYSHCQSNQSYTSSLAETYSPESMKRPSVEPEYTNAKGELIINSRLPLLNNRYRVICVIGRGTFSQLVKAEDMHHPGKHVALKIMHAVYAFIGVQEYSKLAALNVDKHPDRGLIVRFISNFDFHQHFVIAMELMGPSLLRHMKSFPDCLVPHDQIRHITRQILRALAYLRRSNLIHADLKPENVLLTTGDRLRLKLIDFGNAVTPTDAIAYQDEYKLQTLYYRAPEVVLGVPFTFPIDMWSVGCLVVELAIGRPLFLCSNNQELFRAMLALSGPFPSKPYAHAKFAQQYFTKKQFLSSSCDDYIKLDRLSKLLRCHDRDFITFVAGLLEFDPNKRLTPEEALYHPFCAEYLRGQHATAQVHSPQGINDVSYGRLQRSSAYGRGVGYGTGKPYHQQAWQQQQQQHQYDKVVTKSRQSSRSHGSQRSYQERSSRRHSDSASNGYLTQADLLALHQQQQQQPQPQPQQQPSAAMISKPSPLRPANPGPSATARQQHPVAVHDATQLGETLLRPQASSDAPGSVSPGVPYHQPGPATDSL